MELSEMSRKRNVCFTLCNYSMAEVERLAAFGKRECVYLVAGYEGLRDGHTPHLQGFMQLKKQLRFSTIKKETGIDKLHVEECKGSSAANIAYCKKGQLDHEDYMQNGKDKHERFGHGYECAIEEGSPKADPSLSTRTDLQTVAAEVVSGRRMELVARDHSDYYVRYHKGLTALRSITSARPRSSKTPKHVTVLWGPTGVGKSRLAEKRFRGKDYYRWTAFNGKWFDGYYGQKYVIFEEYRGDFAFGQLLALLDRYALQVEYKGGMVQFCANHIIITSPMDPRDWYVNTVETDSVDQLLRRITEIEHIDSEIDFSDDTEVSDNDIF